MDASHPSDLDREEIAGQTAVSAAWSSWGGAANKGRSVVEPRASTPAADSSKWDRREVVGGVGAHPDISTQTQMSVPTHPEARVEAVYSPAKVESRKLVPTPATEVIGSNGSLF